MKKKKCLRRIVLFLAMGVLLLLGAQTTAYGAIARAQVPGLSSGDTSLVKYIAFYQNSPNYLMTEDTYLSLPSASLINSDNSGNIYTFSKFYSYTDGTSWFNPTSTGDNVSMWIDKDSVSQNVGGSMTYNSGATTTLTTGSLTGTNNLAMPQAFTGYPGNGTVAITWEAVPGADGYYIYKRMWDTAGGFGSPRGTWGGASGKALYQLLGSVPSSSNTRYYDNTPVLNTSNKYFYLIFAKTGAFPFTSVSAHSDEILIDFSNIKPVVTEVIPASANNDMARVVTIKGVGFQGTLNGVTLEGAAPLSGATVSNDNTIISATIPSGLAQGTYHLRVTVNGTESNATGMDLFTISGAGPIAPDQMKGTVDATIPLSSTDRIKWTWRDNANNEDGYALVNGTGGLIFTDLPVNTQSTLETGLTANTQYTRAATCWNITAATTSAAVSVYTRANPPDTLTASALDSAHIQLNWTGNGGTRFNVQRSTDNFASSIVNVTSWPTGPTAATYTDSGLTGGTLYYYRVAGYNGDGVVTSYTNITNETTPFGAPATPANFTGAAQSTSSILWSWDASIGASQYYLQDQAHGMVTTVDDPQTSTTETGFGVNTLHTREVVAHNGSGNSAPSTQARKFTLADPPSSLTSPSQTSTTVTLNWTTSIASKYFVDRSTVGSSGPWTTIKTWTDNITLGVAIDSGLSPSTDYWYRVGAYNGDQIKTTTTSVLHVTTSAGVQPATNITGEAFTNQIIWRWVDNAPDETGYSLYDNGVLKGMTGPDIQQTTEAGLNPCDLHSPVVIRALRGPDSSDSASTSEWTLPVAPPTPTDLSRTSTTITISLPKGTNVTPTFNIERQSGAVWTAIATEYSGTSYTDGSVVALTPATPYSYRIYAVNGKHMVSPPSQSLSTSTQGTGFEIEPPTIESVTLNGRRFINRDIIPDRFVLEAYCRDMPIIGASEMYPNGTIEVFVDETSPDGLYLIPSWEGAPSYRLRVTIAIPQALQNTESHLIRIYAKDNNGNSVSWRATGVLIKGSVQVVGPAYNYPNPFRPLSADPAENSTRIAYNLNKDAAITIIVYDITGHEVHRGTYGSGVEGGRAGINSVTWDGKSLFGEVVGNGMYFYKIISSNKVIGDGKIVVFDQQ